MFLISKLWNQHAKFHHLGYLISFGSLIDWYKMKLWVMSVASVWILLFKFLHLNCWNLKFVSGYFSSFLILVVEEKQIIYIKLFPEQQKLFRNLSCGINRKIYTPAFLTTSLTISITLLLEKWSKEKKSNFI